MKAIIFAGGAGTRLWPLSRKKSPKQFEKIVGDSSTLQLAVERLRAVFKPEDIYISTNEMYKDIVTAQLPFIPEKNFIFEPAKRDVGPAVALAMGKLVHEGCTEPVAILWSDHLIKYEKKYQDAITAAAEYVKDGKAHVVFIGHTPRFASENLGWIHYGSEIASQAATPVHTFEGFRYRPDTETAKEYLASGQHAWNLGYFVTTAPFIYDAFKKYAPDIYSAIEGILSGDSLQEKYPLIPSVSFDNAVLERLQKEDAAVIVDDIGWSDVGAWDALKEALQSSTDDTVTRGNIFSRDCADSIIYNYEDQKLVVGVDLKEMIVVNTPDALLIAPKSSIAKVKKVVEGFEGTEHDRLT